MVSEELLLVVRANTTQAVAGLGEVERKASGMARSIGDSLSSVGRKMTTGLTLPIVGVGIAAGKLAMDFETTMAQIEALVGVPKDEMADLEAAALRMGREFGVSAAEAGEGLFFLKSAGLDTVTAIETLEATAMASAMGLGEMSDLANTSTTAMSNFGLTATQAYDNIAMAAKLAKADPAELGRILNNNSSSAALVGMSYEDLGASLALLTRKFGDSRKAGTGMEGILRKLVKPSQMAKDMLDQIGVSAEEFKDMMAADMPGALQTLDAAFAESGVSQSEWLGKVFEDGEAIKAAAAIIQTSGSEIEEVFGGMAESEGALATGWAVMEETAGVKFAKMKESITSALIPLGDIILDIVLPAVESFTDIVGKLAEKFQALDPEGQKMIVFMGGLAAALGPALSGLGMFFKIISFINPIAIVLAAVIGGIAFAAWKMGITWEDVGEVLQTVWDGIMTAFQPVMDFFKENAEWFQAIWEEAVAIFRGIWEDVVAWAKPFLEEVFGWINEQVEDVVAFFEDNWPAIQEVVEKVLRAIQIVWDTVWPHIQKVLEFVWGVIKGVVTAAMNIIKGIIQTVLGILTLDWRRAWEGIKMILSGVWQAIKTVISTAIGAVKLAISSAITFIKTVWRVGWDWIGSKVRSVWDGIKSGIAGAANSVIKIIEGMVNGAIKWVNGLIDKINKIPGVNIPKLGTVSVSRVSLATGGTVMSPTVARVGERGPEEVLLPAGSTVRPLTPGAGGGGVTVNINAPTNDPIGVAKEVGWQLLTRGLVGA